MPECNLSEVWMLKDSSLPEPYHPVWLDKRGWNTSPSVIPGGLDTEGHVIKTGEWMKEDVTACHAIKTGQCVVKDVPTCHGAALSAMLFALGSRCWPHTLDNKRISHLTCGMCMLPNILTIKLIYHGNSLSSHNRHTTSSAWLFL